MFAAPIDWIFQYIRRPKSVITKSEYIERARGLAQRAKEIKVRAEWLVLCGNVHVTGGHTPPVWREARPDVISYQQSTAAAPYAF